MKCYDNSHTEGGSYTTFLDIPTPNMMIFNGKYFCPPKLSVLLIKVAKLGSSLVSLHVLSESAYLIATFISIRLSLLVQIASLCDGYTLHWAVSCNYLHTYKINFVARFFLTRFSSYICLHSTIHAVYVSVLWILNLLVYDLFIWLYIAIVLHILRNMGLLLGSYITSVLYETSFFFQVNWAGLVLPN